MVLSFENELGKITMSGGGDSVWRIKSIDGLGLPTKNFNVVNYAGQDGQETLSVTSNARTITISGDVKNLGQLPFELTKATKIFNKKGMLKLQMGNKKRKTECRVNTFEMGERNGAAQLFVLQLICDDPNFSDFDNKSITVFNRIDKITSPFTLPMVLSERNNEANIVNLGDAKTEPIIHIYLSNTADEINGLTVGNFTTGQFINIITLFSNNDELVINIPKREVTSVMHGNIINNLVDTFLNDFWLDVGNNHISAYIASESTQMTAVCEYSNKYIEAVR